MAEPVEPARAWRCRGDIIFTGEDGDDGVPEELFCLSYILRRSIYKKKIHYDESMIINKLIHIVMHMDHKVLVKLALSVSEW